MSSGAEVPVGWLELWRSPQAVQVLGDRDMAGRAGEVRTQVGSPEGVLCIEVRTGPAPVYREHQGGSGKIEEVRNNTTQQCNGKHMIQCGQSDR
jgi:hypothetical protein